jgi:predicted RecA/RadA family phage recombinase
MNIINKREFKRIDHTPATNLVAGAVVIIGKIKGYTTSAIPADTKGSIVVDGIALCAKATGEEWTRGCALYWDADALNATIESTDNEYIGAAECAAESDDETGRVIWDCSLGGDGEDGAAGADGADGEDGAPGADGADGSVPGGSYIVLQVDDDAGSKAIDTGLTSIDSFNVQILRAGVNVTGDAVLSVADGTITVADGATYALTADDVIYWLAAGTV